MIVLSFMGAAAAAAATAAVATGFPPGDKLMALAFAATAAAVTSFVEGEVGVNAIVGVAWRELWSNKLCKYLGEF